MKNNSFTTFNSAKLLLILSAMVLCFYVAGYFLIRNVYQAGWVGAVYELLWLPVLLSLVVIPVWSFFILLKATGKARIFAALAMALTCCSIVILISH